MNNVILTPKIRRIRDDYLAGTLRPDNVHAHLRKRGLDDEQIETCVNDWDNLRILCSQQQAELEEAGPSPTEREAAIRTIRTEYLEDVRGWTSAYDGLARHTQDRLEIQRLKIDWQHIKDLAHKINTQHTKYAEVVDRLTQLLADNRRTRMLTALETVYGRIRFEADKVLNVVSPMAHSPKQDGDDFNLKTLWALTDNSANATLREATVAILVIVQSYHEANEALHRMETATTFLADFEPQSKTLEDFIKEHAPEDPCDECEHETPEECSTCPYAEASPVAEHFPPAGTRYPYADQDKD